jgi:DNA-binding XRE family transcriptional regulator
MDPLDLLKEVLKTSSQGKIAKEIGVSKSTISLVRRELYPNPQKIYHKITKKYGNKKEIVGAEIKQNGNQIDLIKSLLEEIEGV